MVPEACPTLPLPFSLVDEPTPTCFAVSASLSVPLSPKSRPPSVHSPVAYPSASLAHLVLRTHLPFYIPNH
jgi:hypothetical protein